jgi:glycogen phosphorylase
MDIASELRELARNLYWTWRPDIIDIFRDLDPQLWRAVNHNPVEFLARLPAGELEARAADMALATRVSYAFHRLRDYHGAARTWGAFHAGRLHAFPVAYFSAEFGLHESLPIYSGGLGVLAGDHLKSASDLGVPLVGVGLFYAQGYFNQRIDRDGWQKESYPHIETGKLPLDRARRPDGRPLFVSVRTRSSEIGVAVWTALVGRCRLVLLDSDVDGNSLQDRKLTATLYGGDSGVRIRQELILGVGGLRALQALGITPGVLHLNEGHSAFAALELCRCIMLGESRPFRQVAERAARMTVFTTHTPVEAGHDRFSPDLLEEVVGPLRVELGLNHHELLALGRADPTDRNESFCMTVLGMRMARSINAVSALHGRVTRSMWQPLWPGQSANRVPIGHITNGVHVASWISRPLERLFYRHLGEDWPTHLCYPEAWQPIADVDAVEWWEQHEIIKVRMVDYIQRSLSAQWSERGDDVPPVRLNPEALTIGLARRFASYKRADLLLGDPDRLDRLVNHPERPVQFVFAGKAHPADQTGKELLRDVFRITRDPRFRGKVVFLENHDINVGRHMVQGVDVWLNLPRRPHEACGTSGQKAMFNAGLNVSVLDGWWAEAYDGSNGFAIGIGAEHSNPAHQDWMDMQATYDILENQVVPLFYNRNAADIPMGWVERQKNSICSLAWRYNADRMVMDYTRHCYMEAAEGATCCTRLRWEGG